MSERRFWSYDHEGTRSWNGKIRLGRLQAGFHVYRHRYGRSPDRWVFQPFAIYDRASGLDGGKT